ncbi:MAG TPA: ATP-binding cassette domain-containing protein [Gemmatimonadales bacterium]|nr:ATP-binding cassette domain-containing protein [Gemmatimonadales bacterium]
MTALLELRSIDKRFGPLRALTGASLAARAGEVHALLGENGAGKSTLMNVAYGLLAPDAGQVLVDGSPRTFRSPRDARRAGIGLVHQHFTSIPALSVAENVALFAGWDVAPRALAERVRQLAERVGLPLDPAARAGTLPVPLLQRLEIVKALAADARVLLLDEPTGVLAPQEAEELLALARGFASRGGAVVLITHKLDEALAAADAVTVLRRGQVVASRPVAGLTPRDLAEAMIGDAALLDEPPPRWVAPADPAVCIRLEQLDVPREGSVGMAVRSATLVARAGEIVAVAGVEGNGQRELLRAVAGLVTPLRGRLEVTEPVAFIPEDRTHEGLIPAFTLTENVALGLARSAPWGSGTRLDWHAARAETARIIERLDVKAQGPDTPAHALSGGNQQKLLIGRALAQRPAVLVAENPTRGLDVQATRAVHDRLREAAAQGLAVLVHSTDLDEVLALGHKVVVMARGRLVEVPHGATRAEVGRLMLGAGPTGG